MSFPHITDNHVINFKEEDDYLSCRSQYLQRQRMDIFAPSFLDFVTGSMYAKGSCVVEGVTPIPVTTSVGNDSTFTFTDSNSSLYFNPTNSFTIDTSTMGNFSSGYVYNADTNQIQIAEQSWVNPPAAPSAMDDLVSSIWDTNISYSVGVDLAYNNDGEISDVKVEGKKEKKEEPPDDPIENRWQILDLREDNDD